MPTPPVLDPEPLLLPIPGDDPAGKRLSPLDVRKLKELREEVDPDKLRAAAENIADPNTRQAELAVIAQMQRKVPQWPAILAFGSKYLADTGKDLQVVMAMVEALTRTAGFAGLRDGLRLTRRVCEECWGRMHPAIDDPDSPDDVEGRTNLFAFLTEADRNPFFPNTVRAVPVMPLGEGRAVSFLACQPRGDNPPLPPEVSQDEFRLAVAAAPPARVEAVRVASDDLAEARRELDALDAVLGDKAAAAPPGFGGLRKAIEDCQVLVAEVLRLKSAAGGPDGGGESPPPAAGEPGTAGGGTPLGAVRSREDVYARLAELADLLEQYEPHSPVPFLIRRAIEMRGLRFPELVDALTRDGRVMDFLRTPLSGSQG